jgi:hypothetical protein
MTPSPPAPPPEPKGWQLSATVRATESSGRTEGEAFGLGESRSLTMSRILRRQAKQRFGHIDGASDAVLDALAHGFAREQLEELGERLLDATSCESWLAGVTAPPPVGYPDFAKDLEINLEPDQPSIDSLMKVGMVGGGQGVILFRMQKWYQPDLDKILFDESLRIERQHGYRPMIAVVLMWPAADGPGINGTYTGKDRHGKSVTITYNLRRAWEMAPDDALRSPGTMMFAPLCQGAKDRMPEIIRKIESGLKTGKPEARTVEAVWVTVYWSMGIVCSLEESNAALGAERLAFIYKTKDYCNAKGHCFQDSYDKASKVGALEGARTLILRQGKRRFGADEKAEATLAAITDMDQLQAIAGRMWSATDWVTLLA